MIRLTNSPPTADAFLALRNACGWGTLTLDTATRALAASILHVTAHENGQLVAMGRVVGDGVLYVYLQDIIVAPSHRGQGLGRAMVDRLLADLSPLVTAGTTIGLMSAKGVEGLYAEFGFTPRPTGTLGPGMTKVVS